MISHCLERLGTGSERGHTSYAAGCCPLPQPLPDTPGWPSPRSLPSCWAGQGVQMEVKGTGDKWGWQDEVPPEIWASDQCVSKQKACSGSSLATACYLFHYQAHYFHQRYFKNVCMTVPSVEITVTLTFRPFSMDLSHGSLCCHESWSHLEKVSLACWGRAAPEWYLEWLWEIHECSETVLWHLLRLLMQNRVVWNKQASTIYEGSTQENWTKLSPSMISNTTH